MLSKKSDFTQTNIFLVAVIDEIVKADLLGPCPVKSNMCWLVIVKAALRLDKLKIGGNELQLILVAAQFVAKGHHFL